MAKKLRYQTGGFVDNSPPRDMIKEEFEGNTFYTTEPEAPRGQNGMQQLGVYGGEQDVYSGGMANSFLNSLFSQNYGQGYQQGKDMQLAQDQEAAAEDAVAQTEAEMQEPDPNEFNSIMPGTPAGWERAMSLANVKGEYDVQIQELRQQMVEFQNMLSEYIAFILDADNNTPPAAGESEGTVNWDFGSANRPTGYTQPSSFGTPKLTPEGDIDLVASLAMAENSGNMDFVYHQPGTENTASGPMGLKRGDHAIDYFNSTGFFQGSNTLKYRIKYKEFDNFFNALHSDPELAREVNYDYATNLRRAAGGNPGRAAAFNLAGADGAREFDNKNWDYRKPGNMSIREYLERAGLGGYMRQSGGAVPVLNTPGAKYDGLNNPNIGDRAIIANNGYQQYRGTDDGQPVQLQDVIGNDYTLFGPNDTAWLYGDVYEERVPMGQNGTADSTKPLNYAAYLDNKIGAFIGGNEQLDTYLDEKAAAYSKRNIRNVLKQRNLPFDEDTINFISSVHGKETTFGTNPMAKIQDKIPFFRSVGEYQINPDRFDPVYFPKDYKKYDFDDQTETLYNFYKRHNKKMSPEQMYGFYNTGSTKKLSPYNDEYKRLYNLVTNIP